VVLGLSAAFPTPSTGDMPVSFIDSPFSSKVEYEAWLELGSLFSAEQRAEIEVNRAASCHHATVPPAATHPIRIPSSYIDPITHEIIDDPVITADGHTYSRASITRWLEEHSTSPTTGAVLEHKHLIPNHAMRGAIDEVLRRQQLDESFSDGAESPIRHAHAASKPLIESEVMGTRSSISTELGPLSIGRIDRLRRAADELNEQASSLLRELQDHSLLQPQSETEFGRALDQFSKSRGVRSRQAQFTHVPIRRGMDQMRPLVQAASACGSLIAGGVVRWMCSPAKQPAPTTDVDIFPPDRERLEMLERQLIRLGYERSSLRDTMAVTYKHHELKESRSPAAVVQLVLPRTTAFMNTAAATVRGLLCTLDFTVVRAAIVSETRALVDVDFERDEQLRSLRVRHIVCPISSVRRIAKYTGKGYRINTVEIIKLFAEWSLRAQAEEAEQAKRAAQRSGQLAAAGPVEPSEPPMDEAEASVASAVVLTRVLEAYSRVEAPDLASIATGLYVD